MARNNNNNDFYLNVRVCFLYGHLIFFMIIRRSNTDTPLINVFPRYKWVVFK